MKKKKLLHALAWQIRQLAGCNLPESVETAQNLLHPDGPSWQHPGEERDISVVPYEGHVAEIEGPRGRFFYHPDGRIRVVSK